MTGKPDRLVVDALHDAAIAGDHEGLVIDQIIAKHAVEVAFGQSKAHRHRQTLTQRAGGAFDALQLGVFGVASAHRMQLTERLDVIHRRARIAGEVQQAVDQHRAMPRRQDEPVAVGPARLGGVELEEFGKQHGRDVGHAHGHAGVAAVGRLHCIHRQDPDGIGHGGETVGSEGHCFGVLLNGETGVIRVGFLCGWA